MDTKQSNSKNHLVLWGCLITLIIGIFAFAQVYIFLAIDAMNDRIAQLDNRITRMENRVDERLGKIEERLDKLNENYIDHLERHLDKK